MNDLTHLTDDRKEICAIISEMLDNPNEYGIYPTGRAYDRLEQYIGGIRAELAAANAKLAAIEGLPRHRFDVEVDSKGRACGVFCTPDEKGEVIFATDLQRITNKEKA